MEKTEIKGELFPSEASKDADFLYLHSRITAILADDSKRYMNWLLENERAGTQLDYCSYWYACSRIARVEALKFLYWNIRRGK